VLLPVSDRHLLLGSVLALSCRRRGSASPPSGQPRFLRPRNTERERAYVRNLGRRAAFMTREEMKADAREGFVKLWHSGAEPA
jgi:hypothetical protein